MKLLLNDKEIIEFLKFTSRSFLSNQERRELESIKLEDTHLAEAIGYALEKKGSGKAKKFIRKIKGKIDQAVEDDLKDYIDRVNVVVDKARARRNRLIEKHFLKIISKIGQDNVFKIYKESNIAKGFVKTVGLQLNPAAELVVRSNFNNFQEECLFRNTNGNESLLVNKIDNNFPFWFIDSGYTNFLEGKQKKWHRLTRNHIHHIQDFEAPVDRLGNFKEFPKQWRHDGEFVLVIEPGPFSAAIFHVDINEWKINIETEIRKYTDKPIKFRPKIDKKARSPLYKELLNEDYYCIININSNAATESVWAGVPVITLDRHITSSISRHRISDINNLYRPNIANWLAMLSYSQFTHEELMNGTAVNIIKEYHVKR